MLIQNKLATSVRNQIKLVLQRRFSTSQQASDQNGEEKNNDPNFPYQYNQDWQAQASKIIQQ